MRILAILLAVALGACDAGDPLGLYPEPAAQVIAPLELTGRVVDAAELLAPTQEAEITSALAAIGQDTLAQVIVVTTPSLDGMTIEDYSLALGRGWGIGDKERNDGLLIVVAPNERKVRIEVGYGLEDTIDDPFAARIIDTMTPYFSRGDYAGGIGIGVSRLGDRIRTPVARKVA